MAVIVDDAAFDVVKLDAHAIGLADVAPEASDVFVAYKRVGGRWVPWVAVAQSAALKSIGAVGYGLYTLQDLKPRRQTRLGYSPASRIGRYGGKVIKTFTDLRSREAKADMTALARSGKEHLLAMKVGSQWAVVDGANSGAPFLHRANDARNIPNHVNNIQFSERGIATATRAVPAADFDGAQSLGDIASSELLVAYGARFWDVHETLGQERNPVVIERALMPFLRLKM